MSGAKRDGTAHPDARFDRMALVAMLDSALRLAAFNRLAEDGWRVDAVGDAEGVERRLEKDVYDLIVTDELEIPPVPPRTRVVRIDPETFADGEEWRRRVGGAEA